MTIEQFNQLPESTVKEELIKCCGSINWITKVSIKRPYKNAQELYDYADEAWSTCTAQDGFEAFSHHPKIGDLKNLEKKFASTSQWAGNEQKSVESASMQVLEKLAKQNDAYEERFGFIFIVCATGKSAQEMLDLLEARINNDRDTEIKIAMGEQGKITQLRLKKLLA
jgi:2-oxo-4-hydroxy-4-carboxy-5-ureidoimidazoline decarboxylase